MEDARYKSPEFELWFMLHQTAHLMKRARNKELNRYNTSIVQSGLLFAIHFLGNRATPAELARWLAREPHTVLVALSGMEKKGLIRRTKDLDRKNMVRVSITDKGRQVSEQTTKRESIAHILSCLSEGDRRQLWALLGNLRQRATFYLGMEQQPPVPPFP